MKISVTGANGFIGVHVVRELLRRNVEVLACARRPETLAHLGGRIQIVQMDIAHPAPEGLDELAHTDSLIHLAWEGLPNYQSLHHFETELHRQYAFLKAVMLSGLRGLLVSGTCFEYGMQTGPLSEDCPASPANPYGLAKDCLRKQLDFLNRQTGVPVTWARLFYVYGDGQNRSSLFPQLRNAVSRGEPVFDMSGGEQVRDYLPVEEAARLMVELALRRVNAGPVNVCSGNPISVRALVEGWIRDNNWKIELNLGKYPYPDHEPMAFWGVRTRLDTLLAEG